MNSGGDDAVATAEPEVLYVDDKSQTDAVTGFVQSEYDNLTVVGETSRDKVREQVTEESFDCIVVELKFATAINDVCEDTLLILFTKKDPTAISDDLLDQVDTLVQKGEETHVDFLVNKVFALVGTAEPQQEAGMERIDSSVPDARPEFFLLDDEGAVEWSTSTVDDVFPAVERETLPEDSLHERLTSVAADEYRYTDAMAEAVATDSAVSRLGLAIPRDGPPSVSDTATFSCWSYPLDDPAGRLECYRDVTAEIDQGERLDKLEELVELARDGLYMLDADARYSFVTDRYAELLGYEREELLGRHASSVMSKGALRHGQKAVETLLAEPATESTVVDQIHRHKSCDEIQLSIHFTILTDDDGSYQGLMGVARDVTERRKREQELTEYKRVFETVFDRVYVLDGDGAIRLANEPFASLVGSTMEEIEGAPAESVFDTEAYQEICRVVDSLDSAGERHGGTEVTLTDTAGNSIPCETDVALLPEDIEGGFAGVIRDISERVQREQQVAVLDRVLRHNL